jgi:hypothetical protein
MEFTFPAKSEGPLRDTRESLRRGRTPLRRRPRANVHKDFVGPMPAEDGIPATRPLFPADWHLSRSSCPYGSAGSGMDRSLVHDLMALFRSHHLDMINAASRVLTTHPATVSARIWRRNPPPRQLFFRSWPLRRRISCCRCRGYLGTSGGGRPRDRST